MPDPITLYLGLGSNLGDRGANIDAALRGLHQPPALDVMRRSSLYETAPIGVIDQPEFLNAVAEAHTTLTPVELLGAILRLEKILGRVRNQRWGPRVIDIDILLYSDLVLASPDLTIPHPRLAERSFALRPLVEIAPEAQFPDGETAQKKLRSLEITGNNTGIRLV